MKAQIFSKAGCKYIFLFLAVLFAQVTFAQSYAKLTALKGYDTKVYYSPGQEIRARAIAERCHQAMAYADKLIHFKPAVTLLVLAPADWSSYTKFPFYGMPHYNNDTTLVVAAEDNAFWKSFLPPLAQLPPPLAAQVRKAYGQPDGSLSMQPFFDLLALHELGHAYHRQGNLEIQRKWMGELFSNIFLHTYIAENEPALLPALTIFPRMVVGTGSSAFQFTSLTDLETHYTEIGQKHPQKYGWYQSKLHVAAKNIYDAGGAQVWKTLWSALKEKKKLNDEELAALFSLQVHPSVANVMLKWDEIK